MQLLGNKVESQESSVEIRTARTLQALTELNKLGRLEAELQKQVKGD
jgi:hypothetical protein